MPAEGPVSTPAPHEGRACDGPGWRERERERERGGVLVCLRCQVKGNYFPPKRIEPVRISVSDQVLDTKY